MNRERERVAYIYGVISLSLYCYVILSISIALYAYLILFETEGEVYCMT